MHGRLLGACYPFDRIRITSFLPMCGAGESGELGRAINLDLKESAEEAADGDKPEYDLYRIWKEHLTPVSAWQCCRAGVRVFWFWVDVGAVVD